MKKLTALLLAVSMILSLTACNNANSEGSSGQNKIESTTPKNDDNSNNNPDNDKQNVTNMTIKVDNKTQRR